MVLYLKCVCKRSGEKCRTSVEKCRKIRCRNTHRKHSAQTIKEQFENYKIEQIEDVDFKFNYQGELSTIGNLVFVPKGKCMQNILKASTNLQRQN